MEEGPKSSLSSDFGVCNNNFVLLSTGSSGPDCVAIKYLVDRDGFESAAVTLLKWTPESTVILTGPGKTGKTMLATKLALNASRDRKGELRHAESEIFLPVG